MLLEKGIHLFIYCRHISGCGNTAHPSKICMREHNENSLIHNRNVVSATLQIAIFVSTRIRITYLIIHVYVYLQDMVVIDYF